MEYKLFNISSHKTGTTSIEKIFLDKFENCLFPTTGAEHFSTKIDLNKYISHSLKSEYIFFSDSPFNHFDYYKNINELKTSYNVKFILTIKDKYLWEKSVRKWIKIKNNEGVYNYLYNFYLTNTVEKNVCYYEKRNNEIIEYFKQYKNKLIVIFLEHNDNINKLENFLNIKFNLSVMPHINTNTA